MRTVFTPSEANRTLPLVRRIVADILAGGREIRVLMPRRADPEVAERIAGIERELRDHMRELEGIGCYYKDWGFQTGLVDFPAQIDGADVFLCWRSDEESIGWYHPVEAGFRGRQPIPAELLE